MVSYYKSNELYRMSIQTEFNILSYYSKFTGQAVNEGASMYDQFLAKCQIKHIRKFIEYTETAYV